MSPTAADVCPEVLFHGVEHLEPQGDGWLLQRVPEPVRQDLNPNAQNQMRTAGNFEIRFVADWPTTARIQLSGEGDVWCFFGDY
ncbi:MAG: hypothetical protein R3336_03760, partial [Phycisphaeraceae bacterium]|nr:hypothetical protein [Phycisphaeraceae bacterium]